MCRIIIQAALISVVLLPFLTETTHAAQKQKRPNILFLFSDDQRPDTIGALGNKHIKTPHLDKLVARGFVFHRAYCMGSMQGAVCMPSRTMMLTGRTLFRINRKKVQNMPIFPLVMGNAGYITFRTGKRGNNPPWANKHFHTNINVPRSPNCSKTHTDQAITFLRKRKGEEKPFFLYVAFGHPHDPRRAPKKFMDMYKPGAVPLPQNYLPQHPFDNGEMAIRDERLAPWPRTRSEIGRHLAEYYATITCMDFHIGRIIDTLKEIGEYENTIVIFSSDHGLAIGSHGLMGKQNIYDHSMRVPFIIAGPGVPRNQSSNAFAYLFDVFPTVCDFCGVAIPKNVEGKSLRPIIQGKSKAVRDSVFLGYKVQRAVHTDRWKLIRYTHINKSQLFDMKSDPDEIHNLADDPDHSGKVKEMMVLLRGWQKKLGDRMPLTSTNPSDWKWTPPKGKFKKKGKRKKRKKELNVASGIEAEPLRNLLPNSVWTRDRPKLHFANLEFRRSSLPNKSREPGNRFLRLMRLIRA